MADREGDTGGRSSCKGRSDRACLLGCLGGHFYKWLPADEVSSMHLGDRRGRLRRVMAARAPVCLSSMYPLFVLKSSYLLGVNTNSIFTTLIFT